jgi:flagellar hook protein FlgE
VQGSSQEVGSGSTTIASVFVPQEVQFAKDLTATGAIVGTHIGNSTTTDWTPGTVALTAGAASRVVEVAKLVNFSISNSGAITATYSNGDRLSVRIDPNTVTAGNPSASRTEVIHLPAEGGTYGSDNDGNGTSNAASDAGVVSQHPTAANQVFTAPAGGTAMQGMQMNLQTASVTNNKGLIYDGSNAYRVGPNAGNVAFGHPGSENRGGLQSGALESSNVEISSEFTKMILAQRGVEASSRVISAQSQVLQTIIQSVQ